MTRFIALNAAHQTIPRPLSIGLVEMLANHDSDCLIFNEFVDVRFREANRKALADHGFVHTAVSEVVEYRPGRWHNQILVAAKRSIHGPSVPTDGPNELSRTNILRFQFDGLNVTGLRVPMFQTKDWYAYWEWLSHYLSGDLAIGDFNADPRRQRKKDRVFENLLKTGGWALASSNSAASFFGKREGVTSLVDHAIVKPAVRVSEAAHLTGPVEEGYTDHAAVLIDVSIPTKNLRKSA